MGKIIVWGNPPNKMVNDKNQGIQLYAWYAPKVVLHTHTPAQSRHQNVHRGYLWMSKL